MDGSESSEWLRQVVLDCISDHISLVAKNISLVYAVSCVLMYLQILFSIMLHITFKLEFFQVLFKAVIMSLNIPQSLAKAFIVLKKNSTVFTQAVNGAVGVGTKHKGAKIGQMIN